MALEKLKYRIKRFFHGESGIVEKVEPISEEEIIDKDKYRKYYYSDTQTLVTFKNPLGELITRSSPLIPEILSDNTGLYNTSVYKSYKLGDKFP